jgi:leucyl aminopeptidase (aminopeptidase T)
MDPQRLAHHVIQTSLRIAPDDQVLIYTWQHTLPLAEALALECLRADALPLIHLTTDHIYREMIHVIGEHTLQKTPQHLLAAYNAVSAIVHIAGPENPRVYELGKVGKSAMLEEAQRPLFGRAAERGVRMAWVRAGYLTPERAHKYGVDYTNWLSAHDSALAADPAQMAEAGLYLAERLSNARTIRITHPEGADLSVDCSGRTARIDDGVIDEADTAQGNLWAEVPGGTVSIAPVETSPHGRALFPAVPLWGKVLQDLDWEFKQGELIDVHAYENGLIATDLIADAQGPGSRRLGRLSIGLNPRAHAVAPGLDDHIVRGAVTLGLGENRDLGGENAAGFGWACTLLGATVEVNGQKLVADGKLVM